MPHALILGASRGLGLGLARELVQRGWSVTGTIRKEADRAALEQAGATVATADITDPASIAALAQGAPLDLLFVNAGISELAGLDTIDEAGISHLFMTNAVAPVRAALALRDRLAPDGMVAFMSSRLGSVALATTESLAMYRASKAALNSLTRAMMGRFGDRPVLSFLPGWVVTDMGGSKADIDIETSVKGITDVIQTHRHTKGSAFVDYSGATLPW